jgi:tetratricopeptide (TPR) repeat protein
MSRLPPIFLCGALLAGCAAHPPETPTPAASIAQPPLEAAATASPYGLFLAGRAARDQGQLGAASFYLGRAALAEGEPSYLKAGAFHAALRAGDVPGAASLAPDADDAAIADKRLGVLVRGVEAMAEGHAKAAYTIFTGPDVGPPHRNAALILAPYAAAAAGDTAGAVARPALSDGVSQFMADLDRAQLFEHVGQRKEAEAAYKVLMEGGDQSGLVGAAYGAFLERSHRWDDAAKLYRERLASSPGDPDAPVRLARALKHGRAPAAPSVAGGAAQSLIIPAAVLIAEKQEGVALDYLRLSLRLDPTNEEAWVLVGDLLAPSDPDAARAAYAHVPPTSDRYVGARGKLAWTFQKAGDHDQALKLARETLAGAPASRDAATTLADLLRANQQYAESAAVLTRLIDAAATPDWRLYFLRASAYEEMGQGDKTEADLQAALKLDPDEPELLNFQGYYWIDRGEHLHDALAMVQRAVDAEPQSGEMMDSLGWGYYRLGDFKAAVERLEDAVTLDPAVPEVNDHLGDAYWRVGRKTEAQFQWRRVLSLAPNAALSQRVAAKLASPLGPDYATAPPPGSRTP